MHCEDPGCLRACPADGAIVQYTNGIVDFQQENCIGCQYCVSGCPFDIPKFNSHDEEGLQVHALLGSRRAGARAGVHQVVPDRLPEVRDEDRHAGARRRARDAAARALGISERRRLRSAVDRRHARHLRAARHHEAGAVRRAAGEPADSADATRSGSASRSRLRCCSACFAAPVAFFHYVTEGPEGTAAAAVARGAAMNAAIERFDESARRARSARMGGRSSDAASCCAIRSTRGSCTGASPSSSSSRCSPGSRSTRRGSIAG